MEEESHFYLLRTTTTQEDSVVDMLYQKAIGEIEYAKRTGGEGPGVYGLFHPAPIKGYVFMEARDLGDAILLVQGVPHTKGFVKGELEFEKEVKHLLEPKSAVLDVSKGDMVELIAGPFKGEKAKVIRIDSGKEEVTVELIEATVPIPVTAKGMHIKVVDRVTQETAEASRAKEKAKKIVGPMIGEGPLPALKMDDDDEEEEDLFLAKDTYEEPIKPKKEEKKSDSKEEDSEVSKAENEDDIDEEKAAEEDANYFGGDDDDDPEIIVSKKA